MSMTFYAACLAVLCSPTVELDSIDWTEVSYPLIVDDWRLKGPGAELLASWAAESQFVLFGEQPGVDQIPRVVGAVYMRLFPLGYEYLALEMGPWFGRQVSRNGMTRAVAGSPHSFAFDYDGQVQLIDLVESVFEGNSEFIWGLDQPVIAIHPFARLSEILPTATARRAARGLFLKAALQGGEYLRHDNSADLTMLRQLAGPSLDEESQLIIDSLQKSMEIYVAYRAKKSENGVGVSDRVREQYMCDRLDEQVQIARSHGEHLPKVIFLMGGAHIMEGIGPNGVPTLGEHAQKIARSNGLDALNIGIREYTEQTPLPLTVFDSTSPVTMIDARAVRGVLPESGSTEDEQRLLRDLQQFDALIFIKDAGTDTKTFVHQYEQSFKSTLLLQLSLVLVPAVAFLSILWPCFSVLRMRLKSKSARVHNPIVPWMCVAATLTLFLLMIGVQLLRLLAADAPQFSTLSAGSRIAVFEWTFAAVIVLCLFAALRYQWWSAGRRIHFIVASVSCLVLLWYCHWWNIGAMMG